MWRANRMFVRVYFSKIVPEISEELVITPMAKPYGIDTDIIMHVRLGSKNVEVYVAGSDWSAL